MDVEVWFELAGVDAADDYCAQKVAQADDAAMDFLFGVFVGFFEAQQI